MYSFCLTKKLKIEWKTEEKIINHLNKAATSFDPEPNS